MKDRLKIGYKRSFNSLRRAFGAPNSAILREISLTETTESSLTGTIAEIL